MKKKAKHKKVLTLPNIFLRIEGATVFVLFTLLYFVFGGHILWFVLLIFAPDVSMLGYLINKKTGSISYNLFHIFLSPAVLFLIGFMYGNQFIMLMSYVWFAHIGIDRLLGYGLKYEHNFKETHFEFI